MQNFRNKTLAILIAILLTVSMAASLTQIPNVSAHNPPQNLTTNAYIAALPSSIGLSQSTLIYMWLNRVYGYYPVGEPAGSINYAAVNNNYRFHNYKLTITDPNGENTTKTFETIQDTTSSQSYSFTPTIVGTYTLTFDFPGQTITTSNGSPISVAVNDTYLPSTASTTLIVQQDPIPTFPSSYPLPSEYWTRPIYGENPYWWSISSNWLGTGQPGYFGILASYNSGANGNVYYAGDTVGPQTAHIMWTKQFQTGGIVGGNKFEIQGNAYFEGSAYNQRYQNPIVINGKIYYNEPISFTGSNSGPLKCVDLRTGQLIWSRADLPTMSFALIWDHEDPNQHGVFPAILSTANFARLFDAETGNALFNVTGVPSATPFQVTLGPNGEQLRTIFSNLGNTTNPNWVIAQWNSTKLWTMGTNPFTGGSQLSPAIINASATINSAALVSVPPSPSSTAFYTNTYIVNGGVLNSSDPQNRFDWNYSIGWRNTMPNTPTVVGIIPGDIMLCYNGTLPSQGATFMGTLGFNPYTYFTVNLNASKGTIGSILWMKNYDPPANNVTVLEAGIDPVNRVFTENLRETQTYVGYSIDTGAKLWTTEPQTDMDYYGSQSSGSLANTFAYGKLYVAAYAGIVYCYDTATGNRLWTYGNGGAGNSTDSGFEVPGHYPTFVNAIGNDVVYLITSEHTVQTPIYKGGLARAINATTGAEIWTVSSYTTEFSTTSYAVADGYATWFNSYDDSVYTVGRGPTVSKVSAAATGFPLGGSIVITGTVADISSGATQNEQAARFPNGLPCADDAIMGEWMGYVYQQKPLPSNFYGVEVTLDVVDSNGNFRNIGSARTDASGMYSYQWTPDIAGKYTVIATFHGTNAYWPSYSETAFAVDPAHPTEAPTATPTQSAADLYFVPAIAGLFVAIIVVGALLALLLLRKRA